MYNNLFAKQRFSEMRLNKQWKSQKLNPGLNPCSSPLQSPGSKLYTQAQRHPGIFEPINKLLCWLVEFVNLILQLHLNSKTPETFNITGRPNKTTTTNTLHSGFEMDKLCRDAWIKINSCGSVGGNQHI